MNIELIDERRVLIELCSGDMEELQIKYSTLRADSEEGRTALRRLIYIAQQQTGFRITPDPVFLIEAIPYSGGCFILITLKEKSFRGKKFRILRRNPFQRIFSFESCEDILCALEKLYACRPVRYSSSIILYNGTYFLLITNGTKISAYIRVTAEEYALNSTSDRIIIAHITEHGKYVAKDNAVETAGAALCK